MRQFKCKMELWIEKLYNFEWLLVSFLLVFYLSTLLLFFTVYICKRVFFFFFVDFSEGDVKKILFILNKKYFSLFVFCYSCHLCFRCGEISCSHCQCVTSDKVTTHSDDHSKSTKFKNWKVRPESWMKVWGTSKLFYEVISIVTLIN